MRVLLLLVLVAPLALAQTDAIDWIESEIAPFPNEVAPLKEPLRTTMTTRVSCALAEPVTGGVLMSYVVAEKPAWATVIVSPATDVAPIGECAQGYATPREATLTATASDQAPAFTPGSVVIEIRAGEDAREQADSASAAISAGYLPIFDVQLAEPQAIIPPGGAHDFHLVVTNFGNGATRVEPLLLNGSPGLDVALPAVTILGSKQQGASDISADLVVRVRATPESGFVNRVGSINLRLIGSYALDPSEGIDESTVSFLVTVRGRAGDSSDSTTPLPGPAPLALLALLSLLAVARKARR